MRWLTYQTWEIATPVCLDVNHGQAASGSPFAKDANVILTFLLEIWYKCRYLYTYDYSLLYTHVHTLYPYEHIRKIEPV
jgi:hypothetical protein